MPVPRKVSIASSGVFTIGWPFTLKLVFSTIWRPVVLPTASQQRMKIGIVFAAHRLQARRAIDMSDGRQQVPASPAAHPRW